MNKISCRVVWGELSRVGKNMYIWTIKIFIFELYKNKKKTFRFLYKMLKYFVDNYTPFLSYQENNSKLQPYNYGCNFESLYTFYIQMCHSTY